MVFTNFSSGHRPSLRPGPVAPGEIVKVRGRGFGPLAGQGYQLSPDGRVTTDLGTLRLLFDGVPAPILSAAPGQLCAVVPYGLDGKSASRVELEYQSDRSQAVELAVIKANPAFFSAALNQDNTQNSIENPAPIASIVTVFGTGEGQTIPPGVDGKLGDGELPTPAQPVVVTIGGYPAEVLYVGGAPGQVAGVFQVNARIPASVSPGNAVPVGISVGNHFSQSEMTIAVSRQR